MWCCRSGPARPPSSRRSPSGQVVFFKAPPPGSSNLSPYAGLQFVGEVNLDAQSHEMTVDLRDINGVAVFSRTLQPRNG